MACRQRAGVGGCHGDRGVPPTACAQGIRGASAVVACHRLLCSVTSPLDPSIVVGLQLSGAYYVNAPPGSGDIVFHDPRGALPPFEHTLRYPAQVGHMVVFPSWLVHEVLPNALTGEWASPTTKRVAVSFNLRGQWEDTSDVSVAFPA